MRKNTGLVFATLILISIFTTVTIVPVRAVKTIIVPDDYLTISDAIANAGTGDTVFVKKGNYEGPQNQTMLVNKTISILGEDLKSTTLRLHPPLVPMNIFTFQYMGYLDAIRVDANSVKLSGFTITSDGGGLSATGNGIQVIGNHMSFEVTATGDGIQIMNNNLAGVSLNGSYQTIAENTISEGRKEFLIVCTGSYNTIASNKIAGSTGGISSNGTHNVIFENSVMTQSGISAGVELSGNENILFRNNISNFVLIGSSRVPQSASNTISGNNIMSNIAIIGNHNIFNANYIQGVIIGNAVQDASNNIFYHNNFDFYKNEAWLNGGKTFTVWNGVKGANFLEYGTEGNYYSDYNGSDLDFDGIGDSPYTILTKDLHNYHYVSDFNIADMVLTDNHPLMTPFNVSSVTIELPQWEYNPPPPTIGPVPSVDPIPSPSPSATPLIPTQASALNNETQPLEPPLTPFITTTIAALTVLICTGFLVNFKKRKREVGVA